MWARGRHTAGMWADSPGEQRDDLSKETDSSYVGREADSSHVGKQTDSGFVRNETAVMWARRHTEQA